MLKATIKYKIKAYKKQELTRGTSFRWELVIAYVSVIIGIDYLENLDVLVDSR